MTTHIADSGFGKGRTEVLHRTHQSAHYLAALGRVLYAAIFIVSGFGHFSAQTIGYAAAEGVPSPGLLVPLSGLLSLAGGLSVLLGYRAKLGAWLLVLFLVPVTLVMHAFWAIPDPAMSSMQQVNFMKNLSMLGAALLIAYFGAGPLSLDAKRRRPIVTGA
jgi:putative oxidoreductase